MSKKEQEQLVEKEGLGSKNKKRKVPKWLRALEAQSWQAELLISGLIIAGLLRLPEILIHYLEGYILESTETGFWFLNIASMMVFAGIQSLIIFFAIHFLFRGIWIALLGLNSVYPDGINVDSTAGSGPKYWKKAKEKYPDLSAYNQELDKNCSLIFSIATVTIIILSSISALILIIYLIFSFFISIIPALEDYVIYVAIGLYFAFLVFSMVLGHLMKKYPDSKRIERFAERYSDVLGGFFSFYLFKKPVGYISSIMSSNASSKWGFIIVMLFSFFLGFSGARQTDNNPIYENFESSKYMKFNNKADVFYPYNYENLKPNDIRIFTPIIPSDIISSSILKVFIPTISREEEQVGLNNMGIFKRIMADRATKDSLKHLNLKALIDFNKIVINDSVYTEVEFQYYEHPHQFEEGIIGFIPTDRFNKGKNVLEIRKQYFLNDTIQKIVRIPFYFEPKE